MGPLLIVTAIISAMVVSSFVYMNNKVDSVNSTLGSMQNVDRINASQIDNIDSNIVGTFMSRKYAAARDRDLISLIDGNRNTLLGTLDETHSLLYKESGIRQEELELVDQNMRRESRALNRRINNLTYDNAVFSENVDDRFMSTNNNFKNLQYQMQLREQGAAASNELAVNTAVNTLATVTGGYTLANSTLSNALYTKFNNTSNLIANDLTGFRSQLGGMATTLQNSSNVMFNNLSAATTSWNNDSTRLTMSYASLSNITDNIGRTLTSQLVLQSNVLYGQVGSLTALSDSYMKFLTSNQSTVNSLNALQSSQFNTLTGVQAKMSAVDAFNNTTTTRLGSLEGKINDYFSTIAKIETATNSILTTMSTDKSLPNTAVGVKQFTDLQTRIATALKTDAIELGKRITFLDGNRTFTLGASNGSLDMMLPTLDNSTAFNVVNFNKLPVASIDATGKANFSSGLSINKTSCIELGAGTQKNLNDGKICYTGDSRGVLISGAAGRVTLSDRLSVTGSLDVGPVSFAPSAAADGWMKFTRNGGAEGAYIDMGRLNVSKDANINDLRTSRLTAADAKNPLNMYGGDNPNMAGIYQYNGVTMLGGGGLFVSSAVAGTGINRKTAPGRINAELGIHAGNDVRDIIGQPASAALTSTNGAAFKGVGPMGLWSQFGAPDGNSWIRPGAAGCNVYMGDAQTGSAQITANNIYMNGDVVFKKSVTATADANFTGTTRMGPSGTNATSANTPPQTRLHVFGDALIEADQQTQRGFLKVKNGKSTVSLGIDANANVRGIMSDSALPFSFYTNGKSRMTMNGTASGEIGIGTQTPAQGAALHVKGAETRFEGSMPDAPTLLPAKDGHTYIRPGQNAGNVIVGDRNTGTVSMGNTSTVTIAQGPFQSRGPALFSSGITAQVGTRQVNLVGASMLPDGAGNVMLRPQNPGGRVNLGDVRTANMQIGSDANTNVGVRGKLGVGTDKPGAALHVMHGGEGAMFESGAQNANWVNVKRGDQNMLSMGADDSMRGIKSTGPQDIGLYTNGYGRMFVKGDSGFTGINTQNPTDQLHVSGDTRVEGTAKVNQLGVGTTAPLETAHVKSGNLLVGGDIKFSGNLLWCDENGDNCARLYRKISAAPVFTTVYDTKVPIAGRVPFRSTKAPNLSVSDNVFTYAGTVAIDLTLTVMRPAFKTADNKLVLYIFTYLAGTAGAGITTTWSTGAPFKLTLKPNQSFSISNASANEVMFYDMEMSASYMTEV